MITPHPSTPAAAPALPARIGRYQILDRIGRGAMGVVYSARDEVMDRVVAIKVMAGDLEGDPETRARFDREAKIGGQLLHRNITTVFDLGEADGRLFIVMELLRGQPLKQFLERPEGMVLESKLDLMIQLCEGLSAAHNHGVFHRDVKPSNLYVLNDASLKILDFGIARLATSTMTASGLVIGTPDYMSPEQTVGKDVDHRSDLFSAGAVFYFMLTGRKPFASTDLPAVLRKVQREEPPPITDHEAPPALTRIVLRALSKRREDRQQSARELAADLVSFRRQWEGEARGIAERAREGYVQVESLSAEHAQASGRLSVALVEMSEPLLAALREEYPLLVDHGADGFLRIPFRRDVISGLLHRIESRRQELDAAVRPLRIAVDALQQAEELLCSGSPLQAVSLLETAARAVPRSPIVAAALARGRDQAAHVDKNEAQIQTLLTAAASERVARNWARMRELADEVRVLEPAGNRATVLREEAEAAIGHDRFVRLQALRSALEAGRRAIELGSLDEAEGHAAEASSRAGELGLESALAQVAVLRASLDRTRQAAVQVSQARQLFDSGSRAEALDALRRFQRQEPNAPGVGEAVQRLAAEADRLNAMESGRAEAAAHLASAEAACAAGDAELTRDEAKAALAMDPKSDRALELLIYARVRIRQAHNREARQILARETLREARVLLSQAQASRAAVRAEAAMLISDTPAEAAALLDEALRFASAQRIENLRRRSERERRREAEHGIRNILSAFGRGDWDRAASACEAVLAADDTNQEARTLFTRALRRQTDNAIGPEGMARVEDAGDARDHGSDTETTVDVERTVADGGIHGGSHLGSRIARSLGRVWNKRGHTIVVWSVLMGVFTIAIARWMATRACATKPDDKWLAAMLGMLGS